MDSEKKKQRPRKQKASDRPSGKKRRRQHSSKTRPDRPADQHTAPDRKNHDPSQAPLKKGNGQLLDQLTASEEFQKDLQFIAASVEESRGKDFQIGERAAKWIDNHRYSRVLNPGKFAVLLKEKTGCERSGRQIKNYIDAYEERQLHEKSGKRFPYLDSSHLAEIATCCRRAPDEEHLKLAELANLRKAGVRDIRKLAVGLNAQRHRDERKLDVVALDYRVRHIDGLELLSEQQDASVECVIADWQWCQDVPWSQNADLVQPHHPEDPVGHLVACLEVASRKLSSLGLMLVHHRPSAFLSPRIQEAVDQYGFADAGEHIWDKGCGGFQDQRTPLMPGHEKTILLCRKDCIPKSCCGGVSSVSPKWGAPTRANSGQTKYHPHQKPVWLYELLIGVATVNGLVVDLFAGSGSAGVAAVRLGCPYVGAELIEHYVKVANERIALAGREKQEVVEAVEFFCGDGDSAQSEAITMALSRSGLNIVSDQNGGES